MAYNIESLDVYRRSITTAAGLYEAAGRAETENSGKLAAKLQRTALEMVTSLAGGLGFWEKGQKTTCFVTSQRAALETLPLLELMVSMRLLKAEEGSRMAGEMRDLARMINGLLRGARRREKGGEENGKKAAGGASRGGTDVVS